MPSRARLYMGMFVMSWWSSPTRPAEGLMKRITALPLEDVVDSVVALLGNVNALVTSPEVKSAPENLGALLADARKLVNDPGVRVTGKMVSALKRLGFDSVLDTDFTADLTIMEEGFELLGRLKKAVKEKDHTVALPLTQTLWK